MDYNTEFMDKRVVAYFVRERNVFCVEGKLGRKESEYLTFRNANVTVLSHGEEHQQPGFSGNEFDNKKEEEEDDGSDFSEVRFKESDLIGICAAKTN